MIKITGKTGFATALNSSIFTRLYNKIKLPRRKTTNKEHPERDLEQNTYNWFQVQLHEDGNCRIFISVCNQPPGPTQPSIPLGSLVSKSSAAGQPTRPTQLFVLSGSINEY